MVKKTKNNRVSLLVFSVNLTWFHGKLILFGIGAIRWQADVIYIFVKDC